MERRIILVIVCLAVTSVFATAIAMLPEARAEIFRATIGGQYANVSPIFSGSASYQGYTPSVVVIRPGDTVVWRDISGPHTVTSANITRGRPLFDSSPGVVQTLPRPAGDLLDPGESFTLDTSTLTPGTYLYLCKIHSFMRGTLTITQEASLKALATIISGWGDQLVSWDAFSPSSLTVPKGTVVTWVLLHPAEPHSITALNQTADKKPVFDSSPNFPSTPATPPPPGPGRLTPGQSFNYTFTTPGVFPYYCKIHAFNASNNWVGQVGAVIVLPYGSTDDIGKLNTAISQVGNQATTLSARANSIQDLLDTTNRQISTLNGQAENTNKDVSSLKVQLDSSNKEISSLKSQLDTSNKNADSLKSQLELANNNAASLKNQLDLTNKEIFSLKSQFDTANKNMQALENGQGTTEKNLQSTTSQLGLLMPLAGIALLMGVVGLVLAARSRGQK